jgi:hypothetical protein
MFDLGSGASPTAAVDVAEVRVWIRQVIATGGPDDDRSRLELITALEELKCAAEGLQADLAVALDSSMRQRAAEQGVPTERQGQGIANEIALARRESPHRARQHLGLGKALSAEMPFTRQALREGRISEWRATIIARETACLSRPDRSEVDRRVAGDLEALERMGDRELGDAVRRLAYQMDAESWVTRRRIAESERRVTLRPAPDVMSRVSAELPVAQGVAVYRSLCEHADSVKATGDPRSRGQLMADTFVARLLGTEQPTALPVLAHVVVADDVLFGTREDAAHLDGHGPIPAELARELVRSADQAGQALLRRLYTKPETGELLAADSRSRCFPAGLAGFIRLRDQICRTPWCDAPIRHTDHVLARRRGGKGTRDNGQGLCESCNYTKEALGWTARPRPGPGGHVVDITTRTGHRYTSRPPALTAARWTQNEPGLWTLAG